MKKTFFTLPLFMLATTLLSAQVTPTLWTEYTSNPNAHPNIPNCSYAGYQYGDKALPQGNGKIYNVKDDPYNAKGNNRYDDTEAIRKAIKDAQDAGGGIVYLPNGNYYCSGVLFINADNVIIRGESEEGTIIHFTKSLSEGYSPNYTTVNGNLDQIIWSWAGGMIWITPQSKNTYLDNMPDNLINTWLKGQDTYMADKESWNVEAKLTDVISNEDRGAFSFTVGDASGIKEGDYISIRYKNAADWSLMKYFAGDGKFADNYQWNSGTGWINPQNREFVDWVAQVDKINGNTITLKQPLRVPLRKEWAPQIMAIGDLIQESGVENLTIQLEKDYESQYDNSNWRNSNHNKEKGWNGIYFNNAVNCFAKNVTIYDSEMGAGTAASKNVTITGVKVHGKNKKRSTHHGFTCRRQSQDILFENFELMNYDQFDHGINVEDFSLGNVWHNGIVMKGCFDTHKLIPAECIRTNIKVDVAGGYGGSGEAGPQIGARFVHWNVEIKGNSTNTITPATTMPMGAIVGITGDKPSSSDISGCIVEASNLAVAPEDLYIAQKELRNGILQETSSASPWKVWEAPCRIEAEDATICYVNIDDDSFDDGSGFYLNSFNSPENFAEYDINIPISGKYIFGLRTCSDARGENYLSIQEKGVELGGVAFQGTSRGDWKTQQTTILLNPGIHTIQLKGLKGRPCLNYFTISEATESSQTPFPVFATQPGTYNGFVSVEIVKPENTEVFYKIEGVNPDFIKYEGVPFEISTTSTVVAKAVSNGIESLENRALYEIIPPLSIPCKILAIDYADQKGMSIQAIDGSNNQLSVGQAGDWASYYVEAKEDGEYQVNTRISIKLRDGLTSTGFELYINGEKAASFANLPDMGGNWDRFKIYPAIVDLKKGVNEIKVVALERRFTFDWIEVLKTSSNQLPGEIEAENYHPSSFGYGLHRAINTSEGRPEGFEVAIDSSSKLYYPVSSSKEETLPLYVIACSRASNSTGKLSIKETGEVLATFDIPQVGGSQHQTEINKQITLPKGEFTLCLEAPQGGEYYVDKLKIGEVDTTFIESVTENEAKAPVVTSREIIVSNVLPVDYKIIDISGKIIKAGLCSALSPVDISTLKNGIFIFIAENNKSIKIVR